MRSEVVLLSRNIQIRPVNDASQPWGCQTLTTDLEIAGSAPLYGKSIFSFVEFKQCGQYDTQKAAARFKSNSNPDAPSVLDNCAIHSAKAAGIELDQASNVEITHNNVFMTTQFGIKVKGSNSWILDNNRFLGVRQRDQVLNDGVVDESGVVYICPPYGGECSDYQVTNNIGAGNELGGFYAFAHPCNQEGTQTMFRDNVAHSIKGVGATIFAQPSLHDSECQTISHFAAYKNQQDGLVAFSEYGYLKVKNVILIDNWYGVTLMSSQDALN